MELASCGCQLPSFVCVVCTESSISVAKVEYFTADIYPFAGTGKDQHYRLPRYYNCYGMCLFCIAESEYSAICPKNVCADGYVCAICRAKSIYKLRYSKKKSVDVHFQRLLELNFKR